MIMREVLYILYIDGFKGLTLLGCSILLSLLNSV